MSNWTDLDATLKVDNESASLTDITAHVNSIQAAGTMDLFEDTALNDESKTHLPGKSQLVITLNGFLNSTTEAIWGPLVGNRTSITKTVELQPQGSSNYINGEFWPGDVQLPIGVSALQTWSATLTSSGTINRTSVAL